MRTIRVGTRGSLLARTQTEWVVQQLRTAHPGIEWVLEIIQTTGDARRDVPFAAVGTKGMFVKEIEEALLAEHIAIGVHSMKDMPSELPEGLVLGAIPKREDPRDAFLSSGLSLADLPQGARVGTSSIRRQALVKHLRPDLNVQELRGNLDTRLRKLEAGEYDAILLACAGLNRLGLETRVTERLNPEIFIPAVGQGALALEIRAEDQQTKELLQTIHDPVTADAVQAERGFQKALMAGCTVPAGALASVEGEHLTLHGMIAAPDGSQVLQEIRTGRRIKAPEIGMELAEHLLIIGGGDLLKGFRE